MKTQRDLATRKWFVELDEDEVLTTFAKLGLRIGPDDRQKAAASIASAEVARQLEQQRSLSDTVDAMRLKNFRRRYGPHIVLADLPKAKR